MIRHKRITLKSKELVKGRAIGWVLLEDFSLVAARLSDYSRTIKLAIWLE